MKYEIEQLQNMTQDQTKVISLFNTLAFISILLKRTFFSTTKLAPSNYLHFCVMYLA